MYYHASSVKGIKELRPAVSNHGIPLVYLSSKRENVLVYLSNAVEKYCRDTGFSYVGKWEKWGPYGFDENGLQRIWEYYPGALESTYGGVSGYIYSAEDVSDSGFELEIPYAVTGSVPVRVCGSEFVPDALEEILKAEREGLLRITRYGELSDKTREWLKMTVKSEYDEASEHPEYRHFLKGVFPDILA